MVLNVNIPDLMLQRERSSGERRMDGTEGM